LLQGSTCNEQIPAKAYEYIRARKPVIALTDEKGDTAQLLKDLGIGLIAALEDKEEIKQIILKIEKACKEFKVLDDPQVEKFSRQNGTKELAELLNKI